MIVRPILQLMVEDINFDDLPSNWNALDTESFSENKKLWNFQQEALRNIIKVLYLYFKEDGGDKLKFYQRKELVSITIVLGVSFFLNSFASVPVALLAREMKFGVLSINEIIAVVLSGAGAICLAFSGMGVWALVMQNIIYSFVYSMVNMYGAKYIPQFIFKISKIKDMISFGGNLILFNLVNYLARNADNLLIGKFLGSNALGYYDLAYQIMLFPLRRISWTIGEVMFPALSRVQHTLSTVRDAYLRAVRMIASITFPAMLGLSLIHI